MINFAAVMTHAEIYIPAAFILGGLFEIGFSAFKRARRIRKESLWTSILTKLESKNALSDSEMEYIYDLLDSQKTEKTKTYVEVNQCNRFYKKSRKSPMAHHLTLLYSPRYAHNPQWHL